MTDRNCPPRAAPALVRARLNAWFQVKEMPQIARAGPGSRPRAGPADFFFSTLSANALAEMQLGMCENDVLLDLSQFTKTDIFTAATEETLSASDTRTTLAFSR